MLERSTDTRGQLDGHPEGPGTQATDPPGKGRKALVAAIAVGLALVVLAPIALSSSHIYQWANQPWGLGLPPALAAAAFVALDLVAITCVAINVYASLRGDTAPVFVVLTWVFAGGSAWINYQSAEVTPTPLDGQFFAAMSIAGPVMLEATLAKLRKWHRADAGTGARQRPKFGDRWVVSPGETLAAWKAARRENIASPAEAVAFVRESAAIEDMSAEDAARYALAALGGPDEYAAMRWLQSRGRLVPPAVVAEAAAELARPAVARRSRPAAQPVATATPRPAEAAPAVAARPVAQPVASGAAGGPAEAGDRSATPTRPVAEPERSPEHAERSPALAERLAELSDNRSRVAAILEHDPDVSGAEIARRINAAVGPDTISPERGRTLRREVRPEVVAAGAVPRLRSA